MSYSLVVGAPALAQEQFVAQQPYQQPPQGYPQPPQGYPQPRQGYPQPQQGYPNQQSVPFGNAQGQPIQPAQAPIDPMTTAMPMPVVTPSSNKPLQGGIEETGSGQDPSLSAGAAAFGARRPLQGGVEQRDRGMLNGGVEQRDPRMLNGGAQDNGGWQGTAQQGMADQGRPLQAGAQGNGPLSANASNDPDAGNQELDIEWDRWHNALQHAIQSGVLAKINVHDNIQFVWDARTQMMQSRYPNGTTAWYSCNVSPNRKITNIRITQSSRYPTYDQALLQAINDLQGNKILRYPNGSRRQIATQEAAVGTAPENNFQNMHYGDVERQRY